uniref:Uncharacterized protein n=1 Tax=Glossina brevipalpis TaxID=37001 RepID=A0A1A9WX98_9MUSC
MLRDSSKRGLDEARLNSLDGKSFLRFMRPDCVTFIQNVDEVLKAVYSIAENNRVLLKEYKDECQIALKNNESKIGNTFEVFEIQILAKLRKIETVIGRSNACGNKLQEAAKDRVKGVQKLIEIAGQMEDSRGAQAPSWLEAVSSQDFKG